MDKIKILIADDNINVLNKLCKYFSKIDHFEVLGCVQNGKMAIETIEEKKPHIVLLDLVMPHMNAIGVLKELIDKQIKDVDVIILEEVGQENLKRRALDLGARYSLIKPTDNEIIHFRILDFLKEKLGKELYLEHKIDAIFRNLNVDIDLKSYKYLAETIKVSVLQKDSLNSISNYLYPNVAKKFSTTTSNIEKNVRYIIKRIWEDNRYNMIGLLFKNKIPTNYEFLSSIKGIFLEI